VKITLIVAVSSIYVDWKVWLREILDNNDFSEVILAVNSNIDSIHRVGKLTFIMREDSSIYNAWNQTLKDVKSDYYCFLGVGDKVFNVRPISIGGGDIITPCNVKSDVFFHCGSLFSSGYISLGFDERYAVLSDYEQYVRAKKYKFVKRVGNHRVLMAPGGVSYFLNLKLFVEYWMLLTRYPHEFFYIIKKVIYLGMRTLGIIR